MIEERDQVRSAIRSQLRELALPRRADQSEGLRVDHPQRSDACAAMSNQRELSYLYFQSWSSTIHAQVLGSDPRSGRLDLLLNTVF